MAVEKEFPTRIQHKHDIEENWKKATNFTPKSGELIIYDIDGTHDYIRVKVGDGVTNVNSLPFVHDIITTDEIDSICTTI